MIYVKCADKSEGAILLAKTITQMGTLAKIVPGVPNLRPGDLLINWGTNYREGGGLNCSVKLAPGDKLSELKLFERAGVKTVEFSLTRPANGRWYARQAYHEGGSDLAANLSHGDYYVKHIDTDHEYRVYVFKDRTIATGLKEPEKPEYHPYLRSMKHGWDWSYRLAKVNRMESRHVARTEAIKAIAAVGYDFGGVDVGITRDGKPVVFEVNSRPGLDEYSAERFAETFIDYAGQNH